MTYYVNPPPSASRFGFFTCVYCGKTGAKSGYFQKYCDPCAREHKKGKYCAPEPDVARAYTKRARTRTMQTGIAISARHSRSIVAPCEHEPQLEWIVRIGVPFTYAASKNSLYTLSGGDHVALKKGARAFRDGLAFQMKAAIAGQKIVQNKLWVEIFVQKTSHKGDAINVLDSVCDALKIGIGLDDRWFCIRRIDWEIVKHEPMIYVGIGQEAVEDAQACSSCGRILPFSAFGANRSGKNGVGRNCKDCRRGNTNVERAA